MQKKLIILLSLIILLAVPVTASDEIVVKPVTYPVYFDNQPWTPNVPFMLYNGGTTMAGVREICEKAGLTVEFKDGAAYICSDPEKYVEKMNVINCVAVKAENIGSSTSSIGSGVFYKDYIITCYHVIKGYSTYTITNSERGTFTATLTKYDENLDIAILKKSDSYQSYSPGVVIGDSNILSTNKIIVSIASPKGVLNVVNTGYFDKYTEDYIQYVEDKIYTGSSGGGIFDSSGKLVGIIKEASSYYTHAVPINKFKSILSTLK